MKHNRFYALLAALTLFFTVNAAPVERQDAARIAATFWTGRYGTEAKMVEAGSSAQFPGLYVFNNTKSAGFVIVASDDRVTPIVGYSNQQQADEQVPVSVRAWLQDYSDAVLWCVQNDIEATNEIASQWRRLREGAPLDDPDQPHNTVAAMLTTTWNQSPLYNNLCPYDNSEGERTVTGCVATAMAQIMKFWNSPTVGISSHSYTHATYGRQSANFANTYYAWSQMPNALTRSSTQAQITAVATLMYHCGVAVEMDYGMSSGAQTIAYGSSSAICAENSLKRYFDYKSTLVGMQRSSYTDAVWTARVVSELDAGRPVIYTGRDASGGHAFVCDGYDSRNYFHINWGWGGSYDGFYALNALNPGSGGTGGNSTYTFNSGQCMIVGIEPNSSAQRVTPSTVNLSGLGGSDSVYVRTNNRISSGWTAVCNDSWLTVSPTSGNGGGQQTIMHLSATQNNSGTARIATIVVTQDTTHDTVYVTQPNGTTSTTGWYGRNGGTMYMSFEAGEQLIVRPECLGNFPAGSLLSQIKFSTYGASGYTNNNFTVKVYEGSMLNAGMLANAYTTQVSECLGTLVRSQSYTQRSYGEQSVTLNDPYVVGSRPFWVAVEVGGNSAILVEKRMINCTVAVSNLPLVDSLDGRYLLDYTYNNTHYLQMSYGKTYTNSAQTYAQPYNRDFALSFYINTNPTYTITVNSSNASMGSVTGGGSFRYGDTVTLRATPANDCRFVQWNDGNTDNPRVLTVAGSATYTAQFASNNCVITVTSSDPSKGTATGGGTFRYGTTTTITATPAAHYRFSGWNDGNGQNPRTLTVDGDANFIAYFSGETCNISVSPANSAMGYTSGGGQYAYGTTVTIQATANPGYTFDHWDDGVTQNPRTITVTGDASFVAYFNMHQCQITAVPDDPSHGTVTGSGLYNEGDTAVLRATASTGYRFKRWVCNGQYNMSNPRYLVITPDMGETATVTAEFLPLSYRITVATGGVNEPDNSGYGDVSGAGTYEYGTQATLTAIPYDGKHFVRWTDRVTDNPRIVTVLCDSTFKALFAYDGEGIENAAASGAVVYAGQGAITVTGVAGRQVTVYDELGRMVWQSAASEGDSRRFPVRFSGVYLVRVANAAPVKVVVF